MAEKIRINIFKIKGLYVCKHYFEPEIFKELLKNYNKKNFRFEFGSVGERNKVTKYLDKLGFDVNFVDDYGSYVVKLNKQMKYASILKDAVAFKEIDNDRLFLMKDEVAVEEAILQGAKGSPINNISELCLLW